MRPATTLSMTVFVLAGLAGCNGSVVLNGDATDATDTTPDGAADTAADTATDTGVDAATDDGAETDSGPPPANYALHEWGVMVMEDGGGASMHGPSPGFSGAIPAKPVLYLYPDGEIAPLTVAVDFASGGSTELWPAIPTGPRVEWSNLRLRPGPCTTTPFPSPWDDDPWEGGTCESCQLAPCEVAGAGCLDFTDAVGTATVSDLLFYTGSLPGYAAPLSAVVQRVNDPTSVDRVQVTISNGTPRAVEDVWFVYRQATSVCIDPSACGVTGADLAWTHLDGVAASGSSDAELDVVRVEAELGPDGFPITVPAMPDGWLAMAGDLTAKLVEHGLTADEAAAFLRNWNTTFFGVLGSDSMYVEPLYRDGAALIYFMSREDYDAQLPLTATPPPTETVRVGMIYQPLP